MSGQQIVVYICQVSKDGGKTWANVSQHKSPREVHAQVARLTDANKGSGMKFRAVKRTKTLPR